MVAHKRSHTSVRSTKSARSRKSHRRQRTAEEMKHYREYLTKKANKESDIVAVSPKHIKECAIQLQMMADFYRKWKKEPAKIKIYSDAAKAVLKCNNLYHAILDAPNLIKKEIKIYLRHQSIVPVGSETYEKDYAAAKARLTKK